MKYFYLYILTLSMFIIGMSYYNTYRLINEGFYDKNNKQTEQNKPIVLLGDSILKNNAYVSNGESVESILKKKERNGKIVCLAKDQSKIVDVYSQINSIHADKNKDDYDDLNTSNTNVFLSAGGNDILSHYVDQNQDITDTSSLKPMFSAYKHIVTKIQTKLPDAKIFLLDIYYPDNIRYKQYHAIIQEWNNFIYEFADDRKNNIYKVLKISSVLTHEDDFAFDIEPSSTGGQKIADLILDSTF